jgi:hypothetical protein
MVLVWIYVTGVVMTGLLIMIVEEQERIYIPPKEKVLTYILGSLLWPYVVAWCLIMLIRGRKLK